jgi:tetratricopeptide (TPR) repeat protein
MENNDLKEIVLRNMADLAEIQKQFTQTAEQNRRAEAALRELKNRIAECLDGFDRDRYKSTNNRLEIMALANDILIFDRLGYEIGMNASQFLLGVAAFLEGRNLTALKHFETFMSEAGPNDSNYRNACYLAGMITYNRREFNRATEFFSDAFRQSPENNRDWQCMIYVAELAYFMRKSPPEIERLFRIVEQGLSALPRNLETNFLRATLYLKLGNCYVGTFEEPVTGANPMVNNRIAIQHYKTAKEYCPNPPPPDSLLPVVIDYSFAQALLLSNSIDTSLSKTPSELLEDVFRRLRHIVLTKREEIILAQCYLMLGTCAYYSSNVSKDIGEIYLEHSRNQTLVVPSDICFYSSITKELLTRDEFVKQIDFYNNALALQLQRS